MHFGNLRSLCVTWMGLFGHDLPKCSHVMTNCKEMATLKRTLHPADRKRIKATFINFPTFIDENKQQYGNVHGYGLFRYTDIYIYIMIYNVY